jgi:hypothetical protein
MYCADPLHRTKVVKRPVHMCPDCYTRLENGETLESTVEFHERVEQYSEFIREYMREIFSKEHIYEKDTNTISS